MTSHLRAFLAPLAVVFLASCYGTGMYYPSDGYAPGSYGYGPGGYGYRSYGLFGGFGYTGRCSRCGYNPCRCHRASHACSRCGHNPCRCSGSNQHHHHSSSSGSSERKYRILAGDLGGKKKPNDFHSLDWYHDRGYSLEKLKIETDRGAVIDKRPSSQRSSSSSSSSGRSGSSSSGSRSSGSSGGSSKPSSGSGSLRDHMKAEYQKRG